MDRTIITENFRGIMLLLISSIVLYYSFLLISFLLISYRRKYIDKKKCIYTGCYIIIMLIVGGMYFLKVNTDIAIGILWITVVVTSFVGKYILRFSDLKNKN